MTSRGHHKSFIRLPCYLPANTQYADPRLQGNVCLPSVFLAWIQCTTSLFHCYYALRASILQLHSRFLKSLCSRGSRKWGLSPIWELVWGQAGSRNLAPLSNLYVIYDRQDVGQAPFSHLQVNPAADNSRVHCLMTPPMVSSGCRTAGVAEAWQFPKITRVMSNRPEFWGSIKGWRERDSSWW